MINRAQIIDDAFNLARWDFFFVVVAIDSYWPLQTHVPDSLVFLRAEIVNTTLALDTTKFLAKEVEYMPWETARRNLNYFYLMFDRSEVHGPMQVSGEGSTVVGRPL